MPKSTPRYYWDACVFLKWMNGEKKPAEDLAAVNSMILKFRKREVTIMTSMMSIVEICRSKQPAGSVEMLNDLFGHPNLALLQVTPPSCNAGPGSSQVLSRQD